MFNYPLLESWLKKDCIACCKFCCKKLELFTSARTALTQYATGKEQCEIIDIHDCFFKPKFSPNESRKQLVTASNSNSSTQLELCFQSQMLSRWKFERQ